MDASAYARQLLHLLPPGRLWNRASDSWLSKVFLAISEELARIDARAAQLLNEWDPSTTAEMAEDWERMLGLPDNCSGQIPDSIEERRAAVLQRFAVPGGQTPAFFVALGAALGLEVEVEEFGVCRVGAEVGDLCGDDAWAHAWLVKLPIAASEGGFVAGSLAGDYLGDYGNAAIECVFRRAAPAHSVLLFSYV